MRGRHLSSLGLKTVLTLGPVILPLEFNPRTSHCQVSSHHETGFSLRDLGMANSKEQIHYMQVNSRSASHENTVSYGIRGSITVFTRPRL